MSWGSARRLLGRVAVLSLLGTLPSVAAAPTGPGDASAAPAADPRPNVVFVLADDLGWSDLATGRVNRGNGHDWHDTPAIARLPREGTTVTDAYAGPTCAPTRTALLTGMSAPRPDNNVYAVTSLDRRDRSLRDPLLTPPRQGRADGRAVLPARATTVAEMLGDAGYATGYVGMFHVTGDAAQITGAHGFDVNLGGTAAGDPGRYHAAHGAGGAPRFAPQVGPELDAYAGDYDAAYVAEELAPHAVGVPAADLDRLVGTRKHVTDALADATIDLLDDHAGQPSFTFLSQYAVHTPVAAGQARSDLLRKYRGRTRGQDPATPPYAAPVEGLDQTVARVVHHLETTPDPRRPGDTLDENTVVIVTSDNGGRTGVGAHNGPLRGQKGETREGGVRVPWLAWSGDERLVRRGAVNGSVVDSTDLYATLADYAGAAPRPGARLDGRSLAGVLARGVVLDRPRYQHFPGYMVGQGRQQRPASFVREDRWKLLYHYENRRLRLHDIRQDPGERSDRSRSQRGRTRVMGAGLMRWLRDVDAPLATVRRGREPVRLRIRRGTLTYRDGRITRHRQVSILRVPPGRELPMVLPPVDGR